MQVANKQAIFLCIVRNSVIYAAIFCQKLA